MKSTGLLQRDDTLVNCSEQLYDWLRKRGFTQMHIVLTSAPGDPGDPMATRDARQARAFDMAHALLEGLHVATTSADLLFDGDGAPREVGADAIGDIANLLTRAGFVPKPTSEM